ncbi:hypothetical protein GGR54DRAFT_636342 [Hypoxylon sp. NC1633]|nr:hypothetical protein GGR54DRAFT_636342 [Hypoxylon sp. NC1633]
MASHLPITRTSVGSLDDDRFYSAPTSRITSRHVSLATAPRDPYDETNHVPVASPSQPTQNQVSTPVSKRKWAYPFTLDHHHIPKHHHFCPKSISRRFQRTLHGTSDSVPLLQHFANEPDVALGGYVESPIPSPASPDAMARWTSMYTGNRSLGSGKSAFLADSSLEGPIGVNQGTDSIICNVQAYLSNRRHSNCSPQTGILSAAKEGQYDLRCSCSQGRKTASDSYLVSANDIAGILDIVISGLRRVHDDGSTNYIHIAAEHHRSQLEIVIGQCDPRSNQRALSKRYRMCGTIPGRVYARFLSRSFEPNVTQRYEMDEPKTQPHARGVNSNIGAKTSQSETFDFRTRWLYDVLSETPLEVMYQRLADPAGLI